MKAANTRRSIPHITPAKKRMPIILARLFALCCSEATLHGVWSFEPTRGLALLSPNTFCASQASVLNPSAIWAGTVGSKRSRFSRKISLAFSLLGITPETAPSAIARLRLTDFPEDAQRGVGFGRRPSSKPETAYSFGDPSHLPELSFHFMPAFSQSALVVGGAPPPAKAGAVNATTRTRAKVETSSFMVFLSILCRYIRHQQNVRRFVSFRVPLGRRSPDDLDTSLRFTPERKRGRN
jgi:hypothetical protein